MNNRQQGQSVGSSGSGGMQDNANDNTGMVIGSGTGMSGSGGGDFADGMEGVGISSGGLGSIGGSGMGDTGTGGMDRGMSGGIGGSSVDDTTTGVGAGTGNAGGAPSIAGTMDI